MVIILMQFPEGTTCYLSSTLMACLQKGSLFTFISGKWEFGLSISRFAAAISTPDRVPVHCLDPMAEGLSGQTHRCLN